MLPRKPLALLGRFSYASHLQGARFNHQNYSIGCKTRGIIFYIVVFILSFSLFAIRLINRNST